MKNLSMPCYFSPHVSNILLAKQEFQIQILWVVIALSFLGSKKFSILGKCVSGNSPQSSLESKKFPILDKCVSSNTAVNFLGNFWEISGSFLESERVGTFLVVPEIP